MESQLKQLKIKEIIIETEDAKTFLLEPLHGWKPEYKEGQFMILVFSTPFGEKRRAYSISSSPMLKEQLSITIKKVENGEFSRHLLDEVIVGDILQTSGISGFFTLPDEREEVQQIFFLAAGSGITPCFSMIKTILYTRSKQVVLIYSNKNEKDIIFLKQIQKLADQYPNNFQVKFLNSQSEGIFNKRLSKWLLTTFLKEYGRTEKSKMLFYLCGPFEYMRMIQITLLIEDIQQEQIRKEIFTPIPSLNTPTPPDTKKHTVTIHHNGHHYILPVQYPKTILATAKEKNIPLPYSCEAGICGTCSANCVKGNVWMAYNAVLTDKELGEGRVLTCQGFPVGGDVELEF